MELQATICPSCGAPLEVSALFCPQCGSPRPRSKVGVLAPVDPLVGREIIGQYVIVRKVAEGGMGAVYLADQRAVGRQAVVKVMHPELSRDASVAARFELEARAASLLNHPHIVTIYNYGAMEDGTLFLAMEYCRGQSLDALLGQSALGWERAARIGVEICDALAEAHRHGIVHRDLKPSNIMLVEAGRQHDFVKVLDFGIAKLEGTRVTRTGSIIGTPQYMSPEQFRGEKLDGRSDLYSLGILLYEMVAGQLPFESQNTAGFMHKHLEETPQPPSIRVPGLRVPRSFEAIVLCALAKAPEERFADAEEMARALEAVLARPEQIPRTRLMQAPPEEKHRQRRMGLWLGIGGGAVAASVVTVGIGLLVRKTPPPPAAATGSTEKAVWLEPLPSGGSSEPPSGVRHTSASPDAAPAAQVVSALTAKRARPSSGTKSKRGKNRGTVASAGKLVGPSEPSQETGTAGGVSPPPPQRADTPTPNPAPSPGPSPRPGESSSSSSGLVSELKRWMSTARVPPSEVDSTLAAYHKAEANWPSSEREARRREYLGQLVALYRKPSMQLSAGERLPLARLRQIFLSMQTKAPLSADERTRILEATLATYDRGGRPEKDRVYFKRMAVVQLIRTYATDPAQALR